MRFRKSIKIAPGVKLNISKSGVSGTFGVKGASVNVGKNGTYLNTGIPGTGIYDREKLGGNTGAAHDGGVVEQEEVLEASPGLLRFFGILFFIGAALGLLISLSISSIPGIIFSILAALIGVGLVKGKKA